MKGAYVRSKANWIEKGEKNTPYFLRLERQTQSSNVIHEIKIENNKTVKSTCDILHNLCTYYETLYTSDDISDGFIDSYLNDVECITLSN